MNKREIVTGLREQHAKLLTKRERIDEQIEQCETALAAFGVGTRRAPQTAPAPRRKRTPVKEMAERVYNVLTPHAPRSAPELAEMLETGESQIYTALRMLEGQNRAVDSVPAGKQAKHYVRAEMRLRVES